MIPTKKEIEQKLIDLYEWKKRELAQAHNVYLQTKADIRQSYHDQRKRLVRLLDVLEGEDKLRVVPPKAPAPPTDDSGRGGKQADE
jgi:hypothetical protein